MIGSFLVPKGMIPISPKMLGKCVHVCSIYKSHLGGTDICEVTDQSLQSGDWATLHGVGLTNWITPFSQGLSIGKKWKNTNLLIYCPSTLVDFRRPQASTSPGNQGSFSLFPHTALLGSEGRADRLFGTPPFFGTHRPFPTCGPCGFETSPISNIFKIQLVKIYCILVFPMKTALSPHFQTKPFHVVP